MSVSWKDFATTILAMLTFAFYYAITKGIAFPFISGYRGAILVLTVIGVSMCTFSARTRDRSNPFIVIASILGTASLGLIIYGLVTGAQIAFIYLTFTILALWLVATLRHIMTA